MRNEILKNQVIVISVFLNSYFLYKVEISLHVSIFEKVLLIPQITMLACYRQRKIVVDTNKGIE